MAEEAKKKKGSSMELIIGLLILTIIGGGGGAVFAHLLQSKADKPAKEVAAKAENKTAKEDEKAEAEKPLVAEPVLVALPPIVANLEAPESRWVRFEASLLVAADDKPVTQELKHRVAQDLMGRIRQFKLSEIEGAEGLLNLRADLTELARIRTNGKARDLIINGLIVE